MASISKKPPAAAMPRAKSKGKGSKGNRQWAAGNGRKGKKRRRKYKDSEPFSSRLLAVVDELHLIDGLLQTTPHVQIAARLADAALNPQFKGAAEHADSLAEWALEAFGVDLDAEVEDDDDDPRSRMDEPDLSDLPNAVSTVIDTARWRLLRVAKVVHLASSAVRDQTSKRPKVHTSK